MSMNCIIARLTLGFLTSNKRDEARRIVQAIRAEALRDAADRAVDYCKQFEGFFEGEDDIGLRAAIYAGEVQ
jgi:hypothetical protein